MRRVVTLVLTSLVLALASPLVASVAARGPGAGQGRTAPVTLRVTTGYSEQFRVSAWVPIRVTIRNRTGALLRGTLEVPDSGYAIRWSTPTFSSLYQMPVVLAPGAVSNVTLYMPGQDIGDEIDVDFRLAGKVVARAVDSPNSYLDQTVSVGALADDVQLTSWLNRARPQKSILTVDHLSLAAFDPLADALASFDAIVLTNVDTSRLDRDQLTALERYVRDGGSLVLIGGPNWQETLRPLPRSLVPGVLSGSRAVANLSGLRPLAGGAPPNRPTIVSLLTHPRGTVLASQAGIPLVVRDGLGQGRIVYLAFDPAVDAIPHWRDAPRLLTTLLQQSAPQVVSRLSSVGWHRGFFRGQLGPDTIRQELSNVTSQISPLVSLLILLTLGSLLLLGPLNLLVLHRLGRQGLALITVPVLAVLCFASTLSATFRFKGNIALLNTVGLVELDGAGQTRPTTLYVGLFAPVRGDYHLIWNGQALPQGLPDYSFDQSSSPSSYPLGLRFQEGPRTAVDFLSMPTSSTRSVALKTTVAIPGTLRASLHLAPDGSIEGVVRNTTALTIIRPLIVAGSAVLSLADMPPDATRSVHIMPTVKGDDQTPLWDQIYGATSDALTSWDGDPWEEPSVGVEKSLVDRLRNVGERMPEARDVTALGEVLFLGWSENHLGVFTVDGATPQRRDLNLIVSPLSIRFPRGSFRLQPGTLGATLVEDQARQPSNECCDSPLSNQAVAMGAGGSATFEFDVPNARHLHFSHLSLSVNASGAEEAATVQAYDWQTRQWVTIRFKTASVSLSQPDRLISPSGALLMRLRATRASGDVVINNPRHDLQLSGWATAR